MANFNNFRQQQIVRALDNLVGEGENLLVRNQHGEIIVEPVLGSQLREEHPRLYGLLLSANEQLLGGCGWSFVGTVLAWAISLGLSLGWWDAVVGAQVADELRNSWWFYLGIFALGMFGPFYLVELYARVKYRGLRPELRVTMEAEGFDRDLLVAAIQGDDELSTVARFLKLDREMSALPKGET